MCSVSNIGFLFKFKVTHETCAMQTCRQYMYEMVIWVFVSQTCRAHGATHARHSNITLKRNEFPFPISLWVVSFVRFKLLLFFFYLCFAICFPSTTSLSNNQRYHFYISLWSLYTYFVVLSIFVWSHANDQAFV